MKIEYERIGDFDIPKFEIDDNNQVINRYVRLKLNYLKENNKALYTTLLMKNELTDYLVSVGNDAENRFSQLMKNFKNNDKRLSEKYKESNQLEWVKLMNNYKNEADEIILNELIFV